MVVAAERHAVRRREFPHQPHRLVLPVIPAHVQRLDASTLGQGLQADLLDAVALAFLTLLGASRRQVLLTNEFRHPHQQLPVQLAGFKVCQHLDLTPFHPPDPLQLAGLLVLAGEFARELNRV